MVHTGHTFHAGRRHGRTRPDEPPPRRIGRAVVATALAAPLLLAGCTGSSHHDGATSAPAGPSHRVAFQVDGSGTADLGYSTGTTARSGKVAHAVLPWTKTVSATGAGYVLTVVLGPSGGDAACSISVDGRKLTGSRAHGPYGRATCTTGTSRADG
ncbi:MmpS family transport accessory protein [Actinacidiphila rubida]|uniref:Membrane protein n=1 Tax=Actinacidiphila rubida TaxID=310780 RepID=A0A1H8E571_9ACTN|nr:MmpS family transport accessory protein [Actinacidiphila rubida]SEN14642.1 membrane protein [Actinacidiphila rubida]